MQNAVWDFGLRGAKLKSAFPGAFSGVKVKSGPGAGVKSVFSVRFGAARLNPSEGARRVHPRSGRAPVAWLCKCIEKKAHAVRPYICLLPFAFRLTPLKAEAVRPYLEHSSLRPSYLALTVAAMAVICSAERWRKRPWARM